MPVNYTESIKRPFRSFRDGFLGLLVSILPIVNLMFLGYLMDIGRTAMKRDFSLPQWHDVGRLFLNGILVVIIAAIYAIPFVIIAALAVFTGVLTMPAGIFALNINALTLITLTKTVIAWMTGLGIMMFIVLLFKILYYLTLSAALLRFAETNNFGSAFEFKYVLKKAFTGKFIGTWIIVTALVAIATTVLGMVHWIGLLIVPYVFGIFAFTALGQTYSEV